MKATDVRGPELAPPIVQEVVGGPGRPLDPSTRAVMDERFGHDFASVRVHADARAADSARGVGAQAYTVGEHIVLGAAAPSPQTAAGRDLLAHELTHTLQQRGGASPAADPSTAALSHLEVAAESSPHEREADAMALAVTNGARVAEMAGVAGPRTPVVQRQEEPRRRPVQKELDADAEKVVSVVMPNPRDKRDPQAKAVELVYRILNQYFPGYASKVSGVGFDNAKAKDGLETHQQVAKDKTFYGFIWVGDAFVRDLIENKHLLASKVAKVAHELEHIDQWRSGMAGEGNKNEREFLAHYHEAVFVARPGSGTIPHSSRARHLDAALGLFNCFGAELQKKYLSIQQELLAKRPHEVKFGHKEQYPDPPAKCMQPDDFGFGKETKE